MIPRAHAVPTYTLGTIPFLGQEGTTFTIVLQVGGANGGTPYQFRFWVKDPAAKLHSSVLQNYTTSPGQTQFTLPVFFYPTSSFPGPNELVGQYFLNATQVRPLVVNPTVAQTYFLIFLTDNYQYQRTETVNVQATGYSLAEPAAVKIATASTPPTTVFALNTTASLSGVVTASWHIPPDAILDPKGYIVTVTGTTTVKTPADGSGNASHHCRRHCLCSNRATSKTERHSILPRRHDTHNWNGREIIPNLHRNARRHAHCSIDL